MRKTKQILIGLLFLASLVLPVVAMRPGPGTEYKDPHETSPAGIVLCHNTSTQD